jgi:glycerophosphoryl diester phosphodiesterase
VAHRGATANAVQNTLAAFRTALALGADAVELDVRLSADGVPVVYHYARKQSQQVMARYGRTVWPSWMLCALADRMANGYQDSTPCSRSSPAG